MRLARSKVALLLMEPPVRWLRYQTFTLEAPAPGYTCEPALVGKPTNMEEEFRKQGELHIHTSTGSGSKPVSVVHSGPSTASLSFPVLSDKVFPCPTCTSHIIPAIQGNIPWHLYSNVQVISYVPDVSKWYVKMNIGGLQAQDDII